MNMHSHIQLPNGILKHFRDETDMEKKVWCLDLDSGQISRKATGRLGTAKEYYSAEMELWLSAQIESPITALNKKIRRFAAGMEDSVSILPDDVRVAKSYIKAAWLRSNMAQWEFGESSYTAAVCSKQENHDDLIYAGLCSKGPFDKYLADMSMAVLINRTNAHFVVPRNCYYEILSHSCATIVAPISPTAAILLLPRDYPVFALGCYGTIDDAEDVRKANQAALKYEYCCNHDFVAADRETELKDLLATLDAIKKTDKLS